MTSVPAPPSGTDLAQAYHDDIVRPLLLGRWPDLPYAAGRLGSGSDVLGLDDAVSRDHDWGLRLTVLVPRGLVEPVRAHLEAGLPPSYAGWPTAFATTWRPDAGLGVEVDTVSSFSSSRLGVDPTAGMDPVGWLGLTGQGVLEVTAGPVFADREGSLTRVRDALRWYPDDLWRYVLAADWSRLAQDLPLAARAAQRGDAVGSALLTARLVGTAMHLAFLLERRWPPYAKWLGTVFTGLALAPSAGPALVRALEEQAWTDREAALVQVLDVLLAEQARLGLPVPPTATVPFWARPFRGVDERVAALLLASITDPDVTALPGGVGSVEQWVDSVAVLRDPVRRQSAARSLLVPSA